jgi:uncharacterized protein YidB (DUF937 family)
MNLNDLMKAGMNALGGGSPGGTPAGLEAVLGQVLGQQAGGLDGLISKFNHAGMGAISGDQLKAVLGNDQVAAIAKQLGVDPTQAMGQLSAILPGLVDKMTPDGTVPPATDLHGQLGGILGSLFGKK